MAAAAGRDDGDRREAPGGSLSSAGSRPCGDGRRPGPNAGRRRPDNDQTLRPLSADEIPPNLSFYAMDPLYKPGVPLGWSTTRIDERSIAAWSRSRSASAACISAGACWRAIPQTVAFNVFRQAGGGAPVSGSRARPISATTDYTDAERRAIRRTWWVRVGRPRRRPPSSERAGRRRAPAFRDPRSAARRRAERRSRRHRRPERRRRLRLRRQAPGRQHRSGPAPCRARTLQDRRLQRPHRRVHVAHRSRLEHQPRHLVLADGRARSRRRRQGRGRGAARAIRGDREQMLDGGKGVRPRWPRVPGASTTARPARRSTRSTGSSAGRSPTGPIDRATGRAVTCWASRISTARRRACSSCAAPTGLMKVDAWTLRNRKLEKIWRWTNERAPFMYQGQGQHSIKVGGHRRRRRRRDPERLDRDRQRRPDDVGHRAGHGDRFYLSDIDPDRPGPRGLVHDRGSASAERRQPLGRAEAAR